LFKYLVSFITFQISIISLTSFYYNSNILFPGQRWVYPELWLIYKVIQGKSRKKLVTGWVQFLNPLHLECGVFFDWHVMTYCLATFASVLCKFELLLDTLFAFHLRNEERAK
jgi:hypothetical protein